MSPPPDLPQGVPPPEFRKQLRCRTIAAREALSDVERTRLTVALSAHLAPLLARLAPQRIGFCWPYRGEPDLTRLIGEWLAQDSNRAAALPVVRGEAEPLRFARWHPETAMCEGAYGIPVPQTQALLAPDLVLVPLNAFDARGFRVGYGGGYFDRTLVAMTPKPCTVGVGFELGRVDSIHPEPHDCPLDWIVTEAGVFYCH